MNEFDLIEKYLSPLACGDDASLCLKDDAAVIPFGETHDIIVTKDALVEGIHFLPDTSPADIAYKLLGTNLSDIASMGATPKYYLIASVLPKSTDEQWWKGFTDALAEIQCEYGITLIGGDTVRHNGALTLTLTMIGEVQKGKALKRSGAKDGDAIFVSGTIGDSALGLVALREELNISRESSDFLISRYNKPIPRISVGKELLGIANCATDISDGLVADLRNICDCSDVKAVLNKNAIPLSNQAEEALAISPELFDCISGGGDDYELIFTVSKSAINKLDNIERRTGVKLTQIGHIESGSNVIMLDDKGNEIPIGKSGYSHF